MSITGPKGGDMSMDNLIDEYYVVEARSEGGKIPIKYIVDRPLRTMAFTIEKVAGSKSFNQTTHAHMLYSVDCMAPTIFNYCEGLLVILRIS